MPPDPPRRPNSLRLRGYDYAQAGAYFVTICTQRRWPLFGSYANGSITISPAGQMVQIIWDELPDSYPGVDVDAFVVMPDHVHGIVVLSGGRGGLALPDVVQRFKSLTTARYRHHVASSNWPLFPGTLWQRGYHDRIIRDEAHLNATCHYITTNPSRREA